MLKNLKIRKKLLITYAIILAGLVGVSIFGFVSINTINTADGELYQQNLMGVSTSANIFDDYYGLRVTTLKTVHENFTAQGASELTNALNTFKSHVDEQFAAYQQTVINGEDQAILDTLKQRITAYGTSVENLIPLIQSNNQAGAISQLTKTDAAAADVAKQIQNMQTFNEQQGLAKAESNAALGSTTTLVMIIVAGVVFVVGILIAMVVTRSITRPVNKMVSAAEKMADGDTNVQLDVQSGDEIGLLAVAFEKTAGAVSALIDDASMLSEAAVNGEFDTRADAGKHHGDYKKIVDGINHTLDTVVDKIFWYESLLDSIPLPISVTDTDMNWTFINRPVEQLLNVKRAEVIGNHCSNWNANICKTENCGIARLRNGQLRTEFEQMGANFQVDTSYIHDLKGERIGHIEVVQDITEKVRSTVYSKAEVEKLSENLRQLAEGKLNLDLTVAEADQYTLEDKQNFEAINANLQNALDAIASYIGEITRVLGKMADGDMREKIHIDFMGDFARIKDSINSIQEALGTVLLDINEAADQVAAGTRQVADGSQELSMGATEQASSVEQLTASVTQIAAQTKQNAENATTANGLAIGAKQFAAKGNEQMQDMLRSMADINESSHNISKIIKVIDDIAFQTNILALNAAVEAARAGTYGKGFAVVAEEVRDLAAKSAQAAKETTSLIESSIKKVENGTRIANETAQALGQIVSEVDKAAVLVGDIAESSNEQAAGIEQIDKGIEQVSQVVQSNSATAEESAAVTEQLSGQAESLKEMAGRFKLTPQAKKNIIPIDRTMREKKQAVNATIDLGLDKY